MLNDFQNMFKNIPGKVSNFAKEIKQKAQTIHQQHSSSSYQDTSKVPQTYQIQNKTIQQKKLLSQGAFGFIWRAQDTQTKQQYALKRVICMNKQRLNSAMIEKNIMTKLPLNNDHLVKFYGSQIIKGQGKTTIATVMELCSGGSLFDLLQKKQNIGFQQQQILNITLAALKGLHGIHSIGYYHRDVKIENILIGKDGKYKLCDFGSCTNQQVDFKNIPKNQYNDYLEEIQSFTTPMYRSPQMVDPYLKYKVNFKADIWMLGCTIYTLCYFVHPFLDSNAVGISNAVFKFPKYPSQTKYKVSCKIQDLIRLMLTPNPQARPNLSQLANIVTKWESFQQIPLNSVAQKLKQEQQRKQQELQTFNKKTVDIDGDIPIQKLMALQNKLRNKESTNLVSTFITDNQTKKISNQNSNINIQKSQSNNFHFDSHNHPIKTAISLNQNSISNNFDVKDLWGPSPTQNKNNNGNFIKAQNKPSFDAFEDFGVFGSNKRTKKEESKKINGNDFMQFFQDTPVQQNSNKKQEQKKVQKKTQNLIDF